MRPIRVMIDARMCDGRRDGVSRYVTRLIRELCRHDGVTPVALCGERVSDELREPGVELCITDFSRVFLPAHRRLWWEQVRLPSIIRQAGVDLYHATWNTGVPLRCPVPAVLSVHDLIPLSGLMLRDTCTDGRVAHGFSRGGRESANHSCPPPLKRWATRLKRWATHVSVIRRISGNRALAGYFPSRLHRWAYVASLRVAVRQARCIVTVSDYVRNECLNRLNVSADRLRTIHNGVDPVADRAADPELREKNYVLYVGGPEKRKNIAATLQAMDHLWRSQGDAPEFWLTGSLDRQCSAARLAYQRLQYPERVRFLGSPNDAELSRLMVSARALLLLSAAEGFGLPVLEAMACGCPVIVSNRASLPEVAGDAGMIVDPHDSAAVAEAISKVLQDDGLRAELIGCGLRRAAMFSWGKTAREIAEVYRTVLAACHEERWRRVRQTIQQLRRVPQPL
ncbi:MAG: glycosyltransferase family 4 protein [Phycisphaerae bacterium]|nr:glycosyltransferase family 4 protein [Phycisphaerae bacterium]